MEGLKSATRNLGIATAVVDATISDYEAYENPTPGNITKAIFKTGIATLEAAGYLNPFVGVAVGLLDATGVTDKIYNGIGRIIGGAGSADKRTVAPVNGNMTL